MNLVRGITSMNPIILTVDDNEDASNILSRLLQIKGYKVHACHNGIDGFEAAQRLRPAAALLDLAMPGLDGFQLCNLIRNETWGERMFIAALSGYSGDEDKNRCLKAGFNIHLTKPVDFADLVTMLQNNL